MNSLVRLSVFILAVVLMAGCATHPKEMPAHEQGWIGGRYKCAKARPTVANWISGGKHIIYSFPPELKSTQKSGILIIELGTNTPAYHAGLRPGDLILQLAHQPVTTLPAFWNAVHAAQPGVSLPVKAYRDGKMMDGDITVGREQYRNQGVFAVALPLFWESPQLIPTRESPTFSLIALGWERGDNPVEFDTIEQRYRVNCHPKDKQRGYDLDWKCWLAIFQVSRGKEILGQEPVAPADTPSRH